MKKIFVCLAALILLLGIFSACGAPGGVSQVDYDKVVAERDALQAEIDELLATPTPTPTPEPSEYKFSDYLSDLTISTSKPNSAGGVDVEIHFKHEGSTATGDVKYITFTVVPYNAVGDVMSSEIGNKSKTNLRLTGPIAARKESGGIWENVWYNSTITRSIITGIKIEYMTGTIITFAESDISARVIT